MPRWATKLDRWRAGGAHALQQGYLVSIRSLAKNAWGVTAIILTVFSAWLVTVVSFVGRSKDLDRATLSFAISTISTDPLRPMLRIKGRGDELFAQISLPMPKSSRSEIKLSHLREVSSRKTTDNPKARAASRPCSVESTQGPNHYSISYGIADKLSTTKRLSPRGPEVLVNEEQFYRIIVEKVPPVIADKSGTSDDEVEILCDLDLRPFRETFADRKLLIRELGEPPDNDDKEAADGVEVSLSDLEGVSDLHLFSETPDSSTPEDDRLIGTFDGQVLAEWRDTPRAQLRDAILVLIGSLLGLAATCVIEWARPWLSASRHE